MALNNTYVNNTKTLPPGFSKPRLIFYNTV